MTQVKRKGARWLDIGSDRWSYYVGKKFVEIRDSNNKATLVAREKLDQMINVYVQCDCWEMIEETYQRPATLPSAVAKYIRHNLIQ